MTNILLQKTLAESNGEKKLEIDQHLTKLLTKNVVGLFMAHTVLSLLLLRVVEKLLPEHILDF